MIFIALRGDNKIFPYFLLSALRAIKIITISIVRRAITIWVAIQKEAMNKTNTTTKINPNGAKSKTLILRYISHAIFER